MVTPLRALPLLPLLLVLAGGARAAEPGCRAEARVEPDNAVAGQQVLYRVRVMRPDDVVRVEWAEPPAFAHARAEALPPDPRGDVREEGVLYHVHDELRALFAESSGRLSLGGAVLRCVTSAGAVQDLRVGAVSLEVRPFPENSRPPEFTGVVGPLWLHLVVTPERVALGETVRVALLARGGGNLWLLGSPLADSALRGADVFAQPPALELERGRELYVRQHFAWDVVPRKTGRLLIPRLRVSYFDPETGVYREAETQEVQVTVERPAGAPLPPRREAEAVLPQPARSSRGAWIALAVAGALGGAAACWRLRPRGEDLAATALAEASRLRAAGDEAGALAAQSRALRAALARHVPNAQALDSEELEARASQPAARAAAALLASLERARFRPGSPAPEPAEIERAVRALGRGRGFAASSPVLLLFVLGLSAAGCASDPAKRDAPMTPARLETELREHAADLEVVDGQMRFTFGGVRMMSFFDVHYDRMRIVAAVTEESALTVMTARILLQANYGKTYDARYAIGDGMLWAVYVHPLTTLDPRDLESALTQVAKLVRNFGTSYSAGGK
ncbi:MAG TPA: hypothetical protein VFY49_09890 [Myxococcota bacterium]|nr:hypothetical protein [Myxococcota bacterium]